jgi:sugar phosphate isomerase/epimerase
MRLELYRHLWGIDIPFEAAFPRIKAEGFEGIEAWIDPSADSGWLRALLDEHGFDLIAAGGTSGQTVAEHLRSFENLLNRAKVLKAKAVAVQSGMDAWSAAEAESFYREVVEIEKDHDLIIGHETHRSRTFFNPWTTRDVLRKFESLRVVCDFSHWVCVAERTTWDDAFDSILKLCANRCIHVHARVGYAEGPQVPDPSAPEYQAEVEAHERFWDAIWDSQKERGIEVSTLTPEFGPPGYLHTLPHTNVPVADLWKVCKYMADRLHRRWRIRG